jgi:hypothetical protein
MSLQEIQGKWKLKVRRMLECSIPALPTRGCRVLRERAGKGNLLGPSIRKSAQARPVVVVLASHSADATWIGLQEPANLAKTLILDKLSAVRDK